MDPKLATFSSEAALSSVSVTGGGSEPGFLLVLLHRCLRAAECPPSLSDHSSVNHAAAGPTSGSLSPESALLLDVDDDDAQSRHQSQSLDAQEPEQEPEEEHDHRLHYSVPKQHVAESQPAQTLIEHPEQSSHPLAVIQLGPGSGFPRCASPGAGTAAGGESLPDAIELRKKKTQTCRAETAKTH